MINTFVVDTNTLISAHLIDKSVSRKAFNKAIDTGVILYSAETLDEFAKTFIRSKFAKYLSTEKRLSVIREFERRGALIEVEILVTASRDPKDNKFLELAVTTNASCIISGDKDLLILHPFRNIPILNAVDFINNF